MGVVFHEVLGLFCIWTSALKEDTTLLLLFRVSGVVLNGVSLRAIVVRQWLCVHL